MVLRGYRTRRPETARRRRVGAVAVVAAALIATSCSIEPLALDAVDLDSEPSADIIEGALDDGESASDSKSAEESESPSGGASTDDDTVELAGFRVTDPSVHATIAPASCDDFFTLLGPPVDDVRCHTVTVPEDWTDPADGSTVELPVAVFPARNGGSPTSAGDALVYLEGGPGGNAIEGLEFSYTSLVVPFNGTREMVVFDQRGAGLSTPTLDCPTIDDVGIESRQVALSAADEEARWQAAANECHRVLSTRADLSAYHSVFSAIDTEAIRLLLDYEPWHVLGISYGTRLGQTLMRLYPEGVQSVVLDSVVPITADMSPDFAPNAERAFEQLFAGCEADPECAAAYPTFRQDYFDLVDAWDDEPISYNASDSLSGDEYEFIASGDDLLDATFSALYSQSTFAIWPQLVDEAKQGDYDLFGSIISLELANAPFVSLGMLLSVRCHEEEPFEDPADIDSLAPGDPYYERFAVNELDPICEFWDAGRAADDEDQLLQSSIPALLMAGQYDPITPPSGLPVIAEGLTTSWSVVFPHDGHGVSPTDCGAEIVNAFFNDPTTAPDQSCIAETERPAFTPMLGGDITMIPFDTDAGSLSVSGVRPDEWAAQGAGVFARTQTIADPALLLVQGSGGLPAPFVLGFLGDALGWDEEPRFFGEETVGEQPWSIYRSDFDDVSVAAGFLSGDADIFVVFSAYTEEFDDLYERVFLPALEAAR